MRNGAHAGFTFAIAIVAAACGGPPQSTEAPPAALPSARAVPPAGPVATQPSIYTIRGVVKGVAADKGTVTLDHEEIPGLMAAMMMDYRAAEASMLQGLAAGDRVEGRLEARGGEYLLLELKKRP